jgi:hypothetical protein
MNIHRVGVACAVALLATCALLAPACSSSKTIIEVINPSVDAEPKPIGSDVASPLSGDDATVVDATLGPIESGALDTGAADTGLLDTGALDTGLLDTGTTDGPIDVLPSDAGACPDADLSGTVYDPAGQNPIPHVFVFVPTAPSGTIPAITPGASTCDTCDLPIGSYVTATMSDATGKFTLTGAPTGAQVPVVVQLGKWRREISVATTSCQNTALGAGKVHLPRNRSEGDMPAMALLTGGLDDLGCFLTRIGVDPAEYGAPRSGGRLDVYQGLSLGGISGPGLSNGTAGNCTNTSCPLWAVKASLERYDIVLLACEGDTFDSTVDGGLLGGGSANVTAAGKQAMHDWLGEGGKVFATHFHYTWFMNGPSDFQGVASWLGYSLGTGTSTAVIQTSFPKGQDFGNALLDAGALSNGALNLSGVSDSVHSVNAPTVAWLKDQTSQDPKYLTFTTPVGSVCGKAAFSDMHAGSAPSGDIPGSCAAGGLSAQEKAMELLFFDLSACVSDDTKAAPGPPASQ